MTQEEKQLLLKDLCVRLPYGVKVQAVSVYGYTVQVPIDGYCSFNNKFDIDLRWRTLDEFKPYLRPMSSMTEEEKKEYHAIDSRAYTCPEDIAHIPAADRIDWLNKKGFDYRGLIPMGLALEALEGMYKIK